MAMNNINKIIITDQNIDIKKTNNIVIKEKNQELLKSLYLDILNDSDLEIEYNIKEDIKINLDIHIKANVICNIIDKKQGNKFKVKSSYKLDENSNLILNKINDGYNIKECDLFDLNGENGSVKYVMKTVCKENEQYSIIVNHNAKKTKSEIIANGLNIEDGNLVFNVTGYVPKGATDCELMQDNQIINLTTNKCQINPVLLIDEVNVTANHSAHISNFNKDDLFYIQSRGINAKDANELLIKGFLKSKLELIDEDYIDYVSEKYWR